MTLKKNMHVIFINNKLMTKMHILFILQIDSSYIVIEFLSKK